MNDEDTDLTSALVLHPDLRERTDRAAPDSALAEAESLARALGLHLAEGEIVTVQKPTPATLLGAGKVAEIGARLGPAGIGLVVVNAVLSPVQQRNLERAWAAKVLDRTGLILEIFGERAQTREGVLQVELAHLTYQKSRLVRSWTHLERQRGGTGFMGGPGERQIEADRRQLDERITRLKGQLAKVARTRALHRAKRQKVPDPVVALVGYTNAGKSTLFNRLTASEVRVEDMLFATLDPTMRRIALPSGRRAILSDTVGFISDLPHQLVAAFRATLEEVLEADLIVHVRDIAHPESAAQKADVLSVLEELGVGAAARETLVEARNKTDLLPPEEAAAAEAAAAREGDTLAVSAVDGRGVAALLETIEERLFPRRHVVAFRFDQVEGAAVSWLYSHARVGAREDSAEGTWLEAELTATEISRFEKRFGTRHVVARRARLAAE